MFNQENYIKEYNKNNYKMYQFRVKKSQEELISFLDNKKNRNEFIVDILQQKEGEKNILTLKQIKSIIKPILNRHGITDINLFGSYSRGEATTKSDIDIYCNKGNIRTLVDMGGLRNELENALKKKVDIVFTTARMDDDFREQILEDLIKLC